MSITSAVGRTLIDTPQRRNHFYMCFGPKIRRKPKKIEKNFVFPRQPADEVEIVRGQIHKRRSNLSEFSNLGE